MAELPDVVADDAAAVALFPAAVALLPAVVADDAAAVAELAAAVALVVALAASTINAHLAASVFVVIGCDPDDVCAVMTINMLFVLVSLTRSRTA